MVVGDRTVKKKSFFILLKLNCHQFKLNCQIFRRLIVFSRVATKKITKGNTEKEVRRELEYQKKTAKQRRRQNRGTEKQKHIRQVKDKLRISEACTSL